MASNDLRVKIIEWLAWDKNSTTRSEIDQLVIMNQLGELRSRLVGRLAFGTAGLRARMEAGFTRMNDVTILQTSLGLADYLLDEISKMPGRKMKGVVIGYDCRHNSSRWASLAADAMRTRGVPVYLWQEYIATPILVFSVTHLNADAGVMITASHNPKDDNGYKVYWNDGVQISSPVDKGIESYANKIAQGDPVEIRPCDDAQLIDPRNCDASDILEKYFEHEKKFCKNSIDNKNSGLRIAYTPFHGVGQKFTPRLLKDLGFDNVFDTPEQKDPDPDFTTVPFPNPEEGAHVLKWTMDAGDKNNCHIILANDPDADRLQLAEKQKDGTWRVFSGNEMGAMLGYHLFINWRDEHPNESASNVHLIASVVSSRLLGTIAKKEGFNFHQTLTGFKHMGHKAFDLHNESKANVVLLAYEESIGYMPGTSYDKDGIITAALFAELAAQQLCKSASVEDYLHELYQKYGYHLIASSYFINNDGAKTKAFFDSLRYSNGATELKYPSEIAGLRVEYVRDLTVGYDSQQPDNKPILPVSKSSEMITFFLEGGAPLTLRASGTEPKIKYYFELITEPGANSDDARKRLTELETKIVEEFIKPENYGFTRRLVE